MLLQINIAIYKWTHYLETQLLRKSCAYILENYLENKQTYHQQESNKYSLCARVVK